MTFTHTAASWGQSGHDTAAETLKTVPADKPLTPGDRGRLIGAQVFGDNTQRLEAQARLDADDERRAKPKTTRRKSSNDPGSVFDA